MQKNPANIQYQSARYMYRVIIKDNGRLDIPRSILRGSSSWHVLILLSNELLG